MMCVGITVSVPGVGVRPGLGTRLFKHLCKTVSAVQCRLDLRDL